MSVLITGYRGFLGRAFMDQYKNHGSVFTLGRDEGAHYICDLSKDIPRLDRGFDTVLHLAGKAHVVPSSANEAADFFQVNVEGTANLLKAIEESGSFPKSFLYVSSVAVYGQDTGTAIAETAPTLAVDPYGLSKLRAEELVMDWCDKYDVICTIFRLPLIAGPNPPGNLKSMVDGIRKGYYFNIYGITAKKSIVLATDVAAVVERAKLIGGTYNLTDGYDPSVTELSQLIAKQLNKSAPLNIPLSLAQLLAWSGDLMGSNAPINSRKLRKIVSDLTFDDKKAREILGWSPEAVLESFRIG